VPGAQSAAPWGHPRSRLVNSHMRIHRASTLSVLASVRNMLLSGDPYYRHQNPVLYWGGATGFKMRAAGQPCIPAGILKSTWTFFFATTLSPLPSSSELSPRHVLSGLPCYSGHARKNVAISRNSSGIALLSLSGGRRAVGAALLRDSMPGRRMCTMRPGRVFSRGGPR
jgi:hypothetical protein